MDELIIDGTLDEEKYWETGVLAPEICPSGLHTERIGQMIRKALKDFVYRPGFILDQSVRTIGSSYRMRLLVNILRARKHVQDRFSGRR